MKFGHTNLIARDWRRLARFYQVVFECKPVLPERDLQGEWLDRATGVQQSHIRGIHMRLPGFGDDGPTLEIFTYAEAEAEAEQSNAAKTLAPEQAATASAADAFGFSHIAFVVEDVAAIAAKVIAHGGSAAGEYTQRDVEGVGRLTFQYMADPEGNLVEIQNWQRG